MNHSDLKIIQGCDLNLLLSLVILIEEQSVSKSADRLDISQPAMSQNLKKIRALFNTPLFVKHGQGIKATEHAIALLPKLREWLQMSSQLILQQPFDPAETHGVIRIAFMDDLTQQMIPMMLDKIMKEAPNVELEFVHKPRDLFTMLESGELDLAAGGTEAPPANIYGRRLNQDQYCAAFAKTHPLAKIKNPSLTQIFSYETAEYSSSNLVEGQINLMVQAHNLTRKVSFVSNSIMVMMHGLMAGKHVGFIPERALQYELWKDKFVGASIAPLPPLESTLYWHARVHRDPLIQWFKDHCLNIVSSLKDDGTLMQPQK
ncbi:LysR family transcriptional regulator [Shewanella eurypsychrophilus]|uniref:LysR family transcriptional regulator n=1 Tax=Shewanella eurypsychrophilus TaxID=2593656 RepID=A0ABX6V3F7_9GAMM|nr:MULTISPECIES: LysR family transcriptional regulator [Shewanella]QFU21058.1 LysR family transcriptional regulator [Shewanella sp. YLB-09]QPG56347.1 LysR family transcriptional regulator [Shewanella eurypsychrophilus]